MRFLIVGFGSIGRRHFRNLLTLGQKDIIFLRSQKSTLNTKELDGYVVEYDIEKALAHKPDAVILANPTALHLDVAIPAAKAGCHLFFEKPIAESLVKIPDLRKALDDGGGIAVIGFQFRFHPGIQKIKNLLIENAVGGVISARAHWGEYLPDWHPWEDYRKSYSAKKNLGGGVILTLCHPLDYMNFLFDKVSTVFGFTRMVPSLEIEAEAVAEISLRYQSGTIASVHLDYVQRPPSHKIEIIGDQGTIRWDNSDGIVHFFQAESGIWLTFNLPEGFERNDLFLSEMRNFLSVIEGKEEPVCSLDDGIKVQEIVEAVYQSNDEKRIISID
jgi:predicted dehydrogenase